jgi:hypothetical protein
MKNILIPTDFNTGSLSCISDLCRQNQDDNLQLTFIHFFKISDSISDLLMLSRRCREYEHIGDDFYEICEQLKANYPQVKSIKIEFFYGSTLKTLKIFLEEHSINAVLDLTHCSLKPLNKLSLDPHHLIAKCGLEVIKITPELKESAVHSLYVDQMTEAV